MPSPVVRASKASIPTPVFLSAELKVPVVAWPTNNESVKLVPSTFPVKARLAAALPSNKFNSVAVDVTATSSFILGDVNVLFVKVCVPVNVTSPTLLGVIFVNAIES